MVVNQFRKETDNLKVIQEKELFMILMMVMRILMKILILRNIISKIKILSLILVIWMKDSLSKNLMI